jgi:hypothetical protein
MVQCLDDGLPGRREIAQRADDEALEPRDFGIAENDRLRNIVHLIVDRDPRLAQLARQFADALEDVGQSPGDHIGVADAARVLGVQKQRKQLRPQNREIGQNGFVFFRCPLGQFPDRDRPAQQFRPPQIAEMFPRVLCQVVTVELKPCGDAMHALAGGQGQVDLQRIRAMAGSAAFRRASLGMNMPLFRVLIGHHY